MKTTWKSLVLILLVAFAVHGCGKEEEGEADPDSPTPSAQTTEVRLVYLDWADGIALTRLAEVILEDELGVRVQTSLKADDAALFAELAAGGADAFAGAWLPMSHGPEMQDNTETVVDLGAVNAHARLGLAVPAYVTIDSIAELAPASERFGGRIIGIEAGTNIMKATERALEVYALGYDVVNLNGPQMIEALSKAAEASEWVVITGWQPHPMFAELDLKFLADPEEVYGPTETTHVLARAGIKEDLPEVAAVLSAMSLTDRQFAQLMKAVQEAPTARQGAARWATENRTLIESWIPGE